MTKRWLDTQYYLTASLGLLLSHQHFFHFLLGRRVEWALKNKNLKLRVTPIEITINEMRSLWGLSETTKPYDLERYWLKDACARMSVATQIRILKYEPLRSVARGKRIYAYRLKRLDMELPTEAQWEYADRAGTTTIWWTGNTEESLQGAANLADAFFKAHNGPTPWVYTESINDGYSGHAPVGQFRANAFGLYDTAGNVWEWVREKLAPYDLPARPGDGLRDSPERGSFVARGGSFYHPAIHLRSACRYTLTAERRGDVGIRPIMSLSPE